MTKEIRSPKRSYSRKHHLRCGCWNRVGSCIKRSLFFTLACVLFCAFPLSAAVIVHTGPRIENTEAVFFACDFDSTPFRRNLHLTMVPAQKHPEPVLRHGPKGAPDELRAEFYGSVIKIGEKYRMWYCGLGFEDDFHREPEDIKSWVLYAESTNGLDWVKPDLGLVEFHGSRSNNIVGIDLIPHTAFPAERNVHVLYEAEDPDPMRRYKMLLHVPHEGGRMTMVPLFSRDGLSWRYAIPAELTSEIKPRFKLTSIAMPNEHLEGGGLVKFDGLYYENGQSENLYDGTKAGRLVAGYWSADFVHWHPEKTEALVRTGFNPKAYPGDGQESHEGVAIWNRGNVLLGICGLWNGATNWAKRSIDLGFVTSVNAYQFCEPVPDFVFARAGTQGEWDAGGLLQGQGFEQVSDETWIYYGAWNLSAGGNTKAFQKTAFFITEDIGLLKLPRDRFGYVSVLDLKKAKSQETYRTGIGSLMTVPFEITRNGARLEVNADLVSEGRIRFELLDRNGDLKADGAKEVEKSGLRVAVPLGKGGLIEPGIYRLRISIERHGAESPRLYAFYLRQDQ